MEYKLANCILCNSEELTQVINCNSTPIGDNFRNNLIDAKKEKQYQLALNLCKNCGQIQLSHIISPDKVYDTEYLYTTDVSLGLPKHFKSSANNIIKQFNLTKKDMVIEIGSNQGLMLKAFKDYGIKVLGIEPASIAANKAVSDEIETINDFFNLKVATKINKDYKNIKIVIANNVIANIPDLKEIARSIKQILTQNNGVFIFETSYMLDVINDNLIDTIYHEHISYLSVSPLKKFFKDYGLNLFDAQTIDTKGGSIRGFVSSNLQDKDSVRLNKILHKEKNFDSIIDLYNKFKSNLNNLQNELHKLQDNLHSNNEKIICYGASVGCTTMIYNLGLKEINYIIDDNKAKIDKYSPELGIKVYNSNIIYEKNIKTIIILAWRYIEEIAIRHQQFLNRGGKFIIIDLPNNKLVEYKKKENNE